LNIQFNFDNSYSRLPKEFYSKTRPTPVHHPEIVIFNERLAQEIGIINGEASTTQDLQQEMAQVLSGNVIFESMTPIAQAYAGHQYGHFTMLGDGRAVLLGEHVSLAGRRFDIQLKGSGPTPFSRGGDGRAALGPMLREYIISEAMHALGIPTTRSLAVTLTGESVYRTEELAGAILTRIASSHVRVGTFEYAARLRDSHLQKVLADYTIDRHYQCDSSQGNRYLEFLRGTIDKQAYLISKWMLAGFVHGVMNTDNMSLAGETIDYGPCAFMDAFSLETVFSSIDHGGRYAYGNQPYIAQWNLARLAECLLPLIDSDMDRSQTIARDALSEFPTIYKKYYHDGMSKKLGLFHTESDDQKLIDDLLKVLEDSHYDYTVFFRHLMSSLTQCGTDAFRDNPALSEWHLRWQARSKKQSQSLDATLALMRQHNPTVIPRNHYVEAALESATRDHDLKPFFNLLKDLQSPYKDDDEASLYSKPPETLNQNYRTYCGT
jgi:uncharacterized protein YdiU (UPF0061 family)